MRNTELSVAERILLAEELWDSVVKENADLEIPQTQKQELDRRLESYDVEQDRGSSWCDVKRRILAK